MTGVLDALVPQEFAYGGRKVAAELARKVDPMYMGNARNLRETQGTQKVRFHVLTGYPEPFRNHPDRTCARVPRALGEDLQQDPVHGDDREPIAFLELAVQLLRQPHRRRPLNFSGTVQPFGKLLDAPQRLRLNFNNQET
jgi:hypothetical protein